MSFRTELFAQRLTEALRYEPQTGEFVWAKSMSSTGQAGMPAGCVCGRGYNYIRFERRLYRAHRLAWFYVHSRWPKGDLDHINGNKLDNRIANLREASRAENVMNTGARKNNRLGIKGVSPNTSGKFRAVIVKSGKQIHLGTYQTAEEAAEAYRAACVKLYGQFARTA